MAVGINQNLDQNDRISAAKLPRASARRSTIAFILVTPVGMRRTLAVRSEFKRRHPDHSNQHHQGTPLQLHLGRRWSGTELPHRFCRVAAVHPYGRSIVSLELLGLAVGMDAGPTERSIGVQQEGGRKAH
jgi:hypothetical protein